MSPQLTFSRLFFALAVLLSVFSISQADGSESDELKLIATISSPVENVMGTKVIEVNDMSYYMVGELFSDEKNRSSGLVTKIDRSGAIRWQKSLRYRDANTIFADIIAMPNGNVLITGTTKYGYGGLGERGSAYFLELDPMGTMVWEKEISLADVTAGIFLFQVGRDEFIAIGRLRDHGASNTSVRDGIYVLKILSNGEVLSRKSLSINSFSTSAVHRLSDNRFLIIDRANEHKKTSATLKVFILDDAAVTRHENNIKLRESFERIEAIGTTQNGGALVIVSGVKRFALKLDPTGQLEWEKNLTIKGICSINALKSIPKGNINVIGMGCGKYRDQFFILELNKDLEMVSKKTLHALKGETLVNANMGDHLVILSRKRPATDTHYMESSLFVR